MKFAWIHMYMSIIFNPFPPRDSPSLPWRVDEGVGLGGKVKISTLILGLR